MESIETFIENPGDNDISVHEVFTEKMFTELDEKMTKFVWDR